MIPPSRPSIAKLLRVVSRPDRDGFRPPTAAAVCTLEPFKEFRGTLSGKPDSAVAVEGWKNIFSTRPGEIPAAPRGPEKNGPGS